ncbi:MAG: hypothetical protein PHY45_10180 [Rhodocyclaceae bacterium]|nr:hypothetical protein [Rhodocyclaceae bacterium]
MTRSTRATAAVARLNSRSEGRRYLVVMTGAGLFKLHEQVDAADKPISQALLLDDFVRMVDSMAPPKAPRITKSEAAFAKQLVKKSKT